MCPTAKPPVLLQVMIKWSLEVVAKTSHWVVHGCCPHSLLVSAHSFSPARGAPEAMTACLAEGATLSGAFGVRAPPLPNEGGQLGISLLSD